jgi:hypothetical protein
VEFWFFPNALGYLYQAVKRRYEGMLPGSVVLPTKNYNDYISDLNQCDIFLSTFPFGATNGIIDASIQGLPIVNLWGEEAHSSCDGNMTSMIGQPSWLTTSYVEEYVKAVVRLVDDSVLRVQISKNILDSNPYKTFIIENDSSEEGFSKIIDYIYQNHESIQLCEKNISSYNEIIKTCTPRNDKTNIQISDKKSKVFCIGANKTGTTSMEALLRNLGYNLAPQGQAERLIADWAKRDFTRIVEFCKNYNAFQDLPFSLENTYQALDNAFPNSKFILTIRSTPEEWYESYLRFTQKRLKISLMPTWRDLENDTYNYKGFHADAIKAIHGNISSPYDKITYIQFYNNHINQVKRYFMHRPNDLLVINLKDTSARQMLARFLEVSESKIVIPHLNKSK